MAAWLALVMLVVAGTSLLIRGDGDMIGGYDPADIAIIASLLGLIVFAGSSLLSSYRHHWGRALRDLVALAALFGLLIGGYTYRDELATIAYRVAGEFGPTATGGRSEIQPDGERAVRIRRRHDGHFMARADVNGTPLHMLVDTGASTVVLRPSDAQRLGIDIDKLKYTVAVQTANGTTYAAPVPIKKLAIGPISFSEVDALVTRQGMLKDSLLGMSFLNRLRSFEFAGEYLTLKI